MTPHPPLCTALHETLRQLAIEDSETMTPRRDSRLVPGLAHQGLNLFGRRVWPLPCRHRARRSWSGQQHLKLMGLAALGHGSGEAFPVRGR
jgi:hypothetical protein